MDQFSVPDNKLKMRILGRIARYERRKLRFKVAAFWTVIIGSLGVTAFGAVAVFGDALQSGFLQFASLFFYNFSSAMAAFPDLALSMVESFPVFSSAFFLAGIFLAIWSVAKLANEIVFMHAHNISII